MINGIGIYIPNIYYEFDTIDYEILLKKEGHSKSAFFYFTNI